MVVVDGTLYWLSVDCWPQGELSIIVSVFSLITTGCSGMLHRFALGHRYPRSTAFSVMVTALFS